MFVLNIVTLNEKKSSITFLSWNFLFLSYVSHKKSRRLFQQSIDFLCRFAMKWEAAVDKEVRNANLWIKTLTLLQAKFLLHLLIKCVCARMKTSLPAQPIAQYDYIFTCVFWFVKFFLNFFFINFRIYIPFTIYSLWTWQTIFLFFYLTYYKIFLWMRI